MGKEHITTAHGSGGRMTHELITDVFYRHFGNPVLERNDDAAVAEIAGGKIAFTTDTFVVKPVFFPGGDIGKLAVCGTVNDLAVSGAAPEYMSCGFIIEEGFSLGDLEKIVRSMSECAREAGVNIVAGDTKVVGRGEADGIFINTSGVGTVKAGLELGVEKIKPGDKVVISGSVGDHGLAVLGQRKGLEFKSGIISDCAPLNAMLEKAADEAPGIRFMRDPTRGGLATTLNEITAGAGFGIVVEEEKVLVSENVRGACELLGMDPLYIANEGKVLVIVDPAGEEKLLEALRASAYGREAAVIGEVTSSGPGKVRLMTRYGVERIIDMPAAEQLPRIC